MSSTSSWWMPNLSFSIVKIERSVLHQIPSILQDKSIGALKIHYGHHPWSQRCPPCIRKTISGTFWIWRHFLFEILESSTLKKSYFRGLITITLTNFFLGSTNWPLIYHLWASYRPLVLFITKLVVFYEIEV